MGVYTLKPEHEARFPEWRDKWISNAMRTGLLTPSERAKVHDAILGLYSAANLKAPRVIFVPSPFVGAFASGFAAGVWHLRKNPGRAATNAATFAATRGKAESWYSLGASSLSDIAKVAEFFGPRDFMLGCAALYYKMRNGGNQWSGWVSYLSFFRHVAELPLDYSKWDHYEAASIAGPRYMHEEFCLVSEPPLVLKVDDQNRPHCDNSPFCVWSDGSRLYSVHGVQVPGWIVDNPEDITLASIRAETNAEIKRIMREKFGESRYLREIGARVIDVDAVPVERKEGAPSIVRALMEDDEGRRFLIGSDGSTPRTYYMEVDPKVETCSEAHTFLCGIPESRIVAQS